MPTIDWNVQMSSQSENQDFDLDIRVATVASHEHWTCIPCP